MYMAKITLEELKLKYGSPIYRFDTGFVQKEGCSPPVKTIYIYKYKSDNLINIFVVNEYLDGTIIKNPYENDILIQHLLSKIK